MGSKLKKRDREDAQGVHSEEAPTKRRRQVNDDQLKLSKLYEDLAAESDDTRFGAAKQLIVKFSPSSNPKSQEVKTALGRLVKGLCSQRKAARVGFSLTLTELLREIFSAPKDAIEGLDLDVAAIIKLIVDKTKIEGNVPGRERRDHLIGKLFGYKAVLQSSIVLEPELSLGCWNQLLDHIYEMARDIPWLREECGMVLVEAIKSLKGREEYQICAEEIIARLSRFKLVSTPEGVAVWLTVQTAFAQVLPDGVWHGKDPLSKKERSRLAKLLKENFKDDDQQDTSEATKTAAANPNPSFTWNLVLTEMLRRDSEARSHGKEKLEFPQFWLDTVDNNLFSSSASHERKAWGFKLLSNMIALIPDWSISALFSPNLLRTLINQSKKDDRFLHSAALAALSAIQTRAQQEPETTLPIVVALTGNYGSIEFDRITKTKTLEQLLLSADDEGLRKLTRHFNLLILRPDSDDQALADSRRQVIMDLLLNTVKNFRRYDEIEGDVFEKDNWIRRMLDCLVEQAYFVPSKSAKTSKVPLPPISDRGRIMFQERLSSCLTKLLDVNAGSRSAFAMLIIDLIKTKRSASKTLEMVFKADTSVSETLDKALQTLDAISKKGSIGGNKAAAEGFVLLYSLTLLQVFNGEGDAVMLLEDLDTSRAALSRKKKKASDNDGQDPFVEIILSFIGHQRTLFRKIGEEAFTIFASNITSEGLQSLTDILDTEENVEGQKELFNQGDEEASEGASSSDSKNEDDSDVEMIDGEAEDSSDDASASDASADNSDDDSSGGEEDSEDDAELTQFNNLLAITLQTQKPLVDGEMADDSSDESDMDDEQMMALDPHLSKIFKERSKTTSKKKEREEAKQNVVQFKAKVLDLLTIFLTKQYSNSLTLNVILPVVRRTRANANKQTADKAAKMLKTFFDTRTKRKAPLPKPESPEALWELLSEIHEEAKLGGGAKMHAESCSNASLFVVKVLVGLDRTNYSKIVDVYAETQKEWFMDKKSQLQPQLFTLFQNWSLTARQSK